MTETAVAAAEVRPGENGYGLEADRRECNLQVHTENLGELDREEDA